MEHLTMQDDEVSQTTFLESYRDLDNRSKLCLLSFAMFPKDAVVNKKLLIYWWIGEGLIDAAQDEAASDILNELVNKGFLEPVTKMNGLAMDSFRVKFHSHIVTRAKNAGVVFHTDNPHGLCQKTYLLTREEGYDVKKTQALFNVGGSFPDLSLEDFKKMDRVVAVYLGKWRTEDKRHMVAKKTDLLDGLKYMKHLRLFSLQGISKITKLPKCLCELSNLRVLDLKHCHNLEALPDEMGSLKKLTHLDISGCYLLDNMPEGLKKLTELQMLKGFVVGNKKMDNSCGFADLVSLKKLRKLSIKTSTVDFPTENDLLVFAKFKELRKLKIAWEGRSIPANSPVKRRKDKNRANDPAEDPPQLGKNLEKLDLQCYPQKTPPAWLMPDRLKNMTTLYIRGGKLRNLDTIKDQDQKYSKVEVLCLKFLDNFQLPWVDLEALFPHVTCLEKVRCPKLTFYPCDQNGKWMRERDLELDDETWEI